MTPVSYEAVGLEPVLRLSHQDYVSILKTYYGLVNAEYEASGGRLEANSTDNPFLAEPNQIAMLILVFFSA